jgi:hypothetical protein
VDVIIKAMRQKKKTTAQHRSWGLIIISSLIIIGGLTLVTLSIVYIGTFGWWSLLIGVSGLNSIFMATMSIIKNDPSWILLDIIT